MRRSCNALLLPLSVLLYENLHCVRLCIREYRTFLFTLPAWVAFPPYYMSTINITLCDLFNIIIVIIIIHFVFIVHLLLYITFLLHPSFINEDFSLHMCLEEPWESKPPCKSWTKTFIMFHPCPPPYRKKHVERREWFHWERDESEICSFFLVRKMP